jgi:hypothetical protein
MLSSQNSQLALGGSDGLRFAAGFFFLLTLTVAAFAAGRLHFGLDVPTPLRETALIAFVASVLLKTWAVLVAVPASAIAPGSWIALIPAAGFIATIAKRARIEHESSCKIWLATSPPRLKFEAACSPRFRRSKHGYRI